MALTFVSQNKIQSPLAGSLQAARQPGNAPGWLNSLRDTHAQVIAEHGFPTRRWEPWKFIDLRPVFDLAAKPFEPNSVEEGPLQKTLTSQYLLTDASHRLVFVNGFYTPELSHIGALPVGAIVTSLAEALAKYPDRLVPTLGQIPLKPHETMEALNTLYFSDGLCLLLEKNVSLSRPVEVVFVTVGDEATPRLASPRCLLVLAEGAQAQVVTQYIGVESPAETINNAVIEAVLAPKATLDLTTLQDESRTEAAFLTTKFSLSENAQARVVNLALSGKLLRNRVSVHLNGEGAEASMFGLSVVSGQTQVHQHTHVDHAQPGCLSRQIYKGIVDGESRSEFDGEIVVRRDAQKTIAQQLSKNLLLSEKAQVFARPWLRIDADDVKCNHGATVGQLSETERFYLQSRGLSPDVVQRVLTLGFADDLLQQISDPAVRTALHQRVHAVLGGDV